MSIDNLSPDIERALRDALRQAALSVECPADARRRITAADYRVRGSRPGLATTLLAAAAAVVVAGALTAGALGPGKTQRHGTLDGVKAPQHVKAELVAMITSAVKAHSADIERVETTIAGVKGSTTQLVSPDGHTVRVTTYSAAGAQTDEVISPDGERFIDYANKQWWESPSAVKVDGAPAPTADPSALPDLLRSGELVRTGARAAIDGVANAFEVRTARDAQTPTSIWIDPATDLPLRVVTGAVQQDVAWLDPETALYQLQVEPPSGFAQIAPPAGRAAQGSAPAGSSGTPSTGSTTTEGASATRTRRADVHEASGAFLNATVTA
jgi:hypothetical protein